MSFTKYHNLLMFQTSVTTMEVIGEDTSVTDFQTNGAEASMTASEAEAYRALLASILTLRVKHTQLTVLPPGSLFTGLEHLDLNGCTNIAQIPMSYPGTLQTLRASSTKLSSIPSVYASLRLLDVSNCKRISSVGIASLETIVMSHSAITELALCDNLIRLVALSTKVTSLPVAPNLVVVMWSGVANSTLIISPENIALVHVLTSGPEESITTANGVVTSIML